MNLTRVKKIVLYALVLLSVAGSFAGCQPAAPTVQVVPNTPTPWVEATPTPTQTTTPLPSETPKIQVQVEITPTEQAVFIELTEEDFQILTDEQRKELWNKAPSRIDGFIKSNVSTVLNYLVIYRDNHRNAKVVLNLLNNEKSSLLEAGIAEFDLKNIFDPEWDGKKGELRAFVPDIQNGADAKTVEAAEIKTIEEMLKFMVEGGVKWGDFLALKSGDLPEGYEYPHINIAWYISNQTPIGGFMVPNIRGKDKQNKFEISYATVSIQGEEGVIAYYKSPESEYGVLDRSVLVMMSGNRFFELLKENKVAVPPKT